MPTSSDKVADLWHRLQDDPDIGGMIGLAMMLPGVGGQIRSEVDKILQMPPDELDALLVRGATFLTGLVSDELRELRAIEGGGA